MAEVCFHTSELQFHKAYPNPAKVNTAALIPVRGSPMKEPYEWVWVMIPPELSGTGRWVLKPILEIVWQIKDEVLLRDMKVMRDERTT